MAAWIAVLSPALADADAEVDENRRELERIQSRIRAISRSIESMESKKNSLQLQLREIERHYGAVVKSLRVVEKEADAQQRRLRETRGEVDRLRHSLRVQVDALDGQIRAAHAMGRQERIKLVLNQREPAKASRMLVYYDYFNKARVEKLDALKIGLERLKTLELELAQESERLEGLLVSKKSEQAALEATRDERERLLAKVDAEMSDKVSQLAALKEDEKRLQALVASIQRAMDDFPFRAGANRAFAKLKGHLAWPLRGKLAKRYGASRATGRWDGVLIEAEEGTEVRAVGSGRVAYADWLRGYGLLTIIDHGDGYMTLYAFNQSLYKVVGDRVEAGDVIATVGKSGGRVQSGLYFGIRKHGRPEDPVKWCEKERNGRVG